MSLGEEGTSQSLGLSDIRVDWEGLYIELKSHFLYNSHLNDVILDCSSFDLCDKDCNPDGLAKDMYEAALFFKKHCYPV